MLLTHHLLSALSRAPAFQSFELALLAQPLECTAQVSLLTAALASSSWRSVRLLLAGDSPLHVIGGLTQLLPPTSLSFQKSSSVAWRQLRVIIRSQFSSEQCFLLRQTNDDGPLEWQSEY
jgi:hypothetical protein